MDGKIARITRAAAFASMKGRGAHSRIASKQARVTALPRQVHEQHCWPAANAGERQQRLLWQQLLLLYEQ